MSSDTIRLLIAEPTRDAAHDLLAVLHEEPDIAIVGIATTAEQVLHEAEFSDILLLDINVSASPPEQLVHQLVTRYPQLKVIVRGISREKGAVLPFVEAGAAGYVTRRDSRARLLRKVRAASRDEAVVSPRFAARLIARLAELNDVGHLTGVAEPSTAAFDELTPRQTEVLELLCEELSNKEIAARLSIQNGTVKNHVHHILKKLDASSRHEAAAAYRWWTKYREADDVFLANQNQYT